METIMGLAIGQWAALFTIFGIVMGLIKPIRCFIVRCWQKTFGRRGAQLDRIEQELRPNGGSSLRDQVDNISRRQKDFEAFLTASLNIHEEAIFRTDVAGKVIFTNRAHQRLTGFSQGEAYGDGWVNYLAPYERERLQKIWLDVVENERELNEDIMFIRPDHSEYPVRAHVYKETDTTGSIHGYLGIIYPIDEDTGCENHHKCFEQFQKLLAQRPLSEDFA